LKARYLLLGPSPDAVAIGYIVDSCQHCDQCGKGEEQLCRENATQTYNDHDRMNQVNEAFDQLEHGRDIDYRFVIDMASLKAR
jgi:D-arabinose 1-dehydrogenase-like Zn-dependent alcohol dehydrogenase